MAQAVKVKSNRVFGPAHVWLVPFDLKTNDLRPQRQARRVAWHRMTSWRWTANCNRARAWLGLVSCPGVYPPRKTPV